MFKKKDKVKVDSIADIIEKVWGDSSNNDNGAERTVRRQTSKN